MKTRFCLVGFGLVFLTSITSLRAQIPQILNYQGRVVVGTSNFNGTGQFKFALVNANGSTTYWSNDGTSTAGSEPTAAVSLGVSNGLYSVLLGDTGLTNMTAIPTSVFNNSDVRLRVWFNDGTHSSQQLTPDQRIAAVGYAVVAANVPDGAITGAKIANGAVGNSQLGSNLTLAGTTNGTFSGSLSGNATTATNATNFTGSLAGEVTGTQGATVVNATNVSTPNAIVRRDGSGNFAAGTITANGLTLPATSSATVGVISQGGSSLLHAFGSGNFFAGGQAGNFTMTGSANTAFGYQVLLNNTAGTANTAAGYRALLNNTTAGQNVAIGDGALVTQSFDNGGAPWATNNVAVGFEALKANQPFTPITGTKNTALGTQALYSNTSGRENTAAGYQALYSNTTAFRNVAIGNGALFTQSFDSGGGWLSDNVAVGYQALYSNQPTDQFTGYENTAVGTEALYSNTTGYDNTATGKAALRANTTGISNTATGFRALYNNNTGFNNTATGQSALSNNTTGERNTATGAGALSLNSTGRYNTADGESALALNTTAGQNVAIGRKALYTQSFNNGGAAWDSQNVAVGFEALLSNQPTTNGNGIQNTAMGTQALRSNTTGFNNTAVGNLALNQNTTASSNTAVGNRALYLSTGAGNIALGDQAGQSVTAGNNNIDIGNVGNGTDTGIIRIGTAGTHLTTFIAGIRNVTTGVGGAIPVVIDGLGQLGTTSSSRRYKEDIADMGDASAKIQALRPVTFHYKKPYANGEKPVQFGLIAEEVAEVFPELAVFNDEGQPETVKYQDLAPLLLNEFLKERKRADELEERIQQLERAMNTRIPASRTNKQPVRPPLSKTPSNPE